MTIESYTLYMLVCIAATITPGPAVVLIVTNSLKYGFKSSIMTALGNITCLLILCIISTFGVKTLLMDIPAFFTTVKILGAVYLFYLGVKSISRAKNTPNSTINLDIGINGGAKSQSQKNLFKEAFLVAASNPKALIFVFALFPQFVDIEEAHWIEFAILTLTLMAFSFSFLILYAYFSNKMRVILIGDDSLNTIYKSSGIIFILVSIAVIFSD